MKNRPVCLVLLLLILLILLFTGNRVRMGTFLQEDELTLPDGEKLWLIGEVEKKEPTTEGYAVVVKKAYVENMPQKQYRIQVYISKEMSCQIGDKIKMYVKIKRLQVSRNKGMFNQALYYKAKRIQYTGNVKEIQVLERGNVNIREGIFKLRILLYLRLKSVFPEDVSEVLAAILLGIKSGIEEETKNLYQKAGILHLISISGVKTLKLDIPLVPETRINWAFVPLHIAIIYILKLCLDEEIIPRCRFPCSRGYFKKCINWQKK